MNAICRRISLLILLGLSIPTVARAQEPISLSIKDALSAHSFADWAPASFSPDGKKFAYTVRDPVRQRSATMQASTKTGVPFSGIGSDIVVLNVESGESRSITEGTADNWLPVWSPDGHYLAFLSDPESDYASLSLCDSTNTTSRTLSPASLLP